MDHTGQEGGVNLAPSFHSSFNSHMYDMDFKNVETSCIGLTVLLSLLFQLNNSSNTGYRRTTEYSFFCVIYFSLTDVSMMESEAPSSCDTTLPTTHTV